MSIIDFVFEKGNSFHPTDVLNRGVGGNELTIISWAEELVKLGNKVNLFVKGGSNYFYNGVNWYEYNAWNNQAEADVLIDVGGIDTLKKNKQYNKKYLFLGDRVTPNFEKACKERIFDYLICVSQYQKNLYLKQLHRQYHPETLILQCGIDDKLLDFPFNKIPYRIVHASAPYRGLKGVLQMWPAIKKTFENAKLHILGGYKLWGYTEDQAANLLEKDIDIGELKKPGIIYHGALKRNDYLNILASSEIMVYQTKYEEMCCIAVMEACALNVVPIISNIAALSERVTNNKTGFLINKSKSSKKESNCFYIAISNLFNNRNLLYKLLIETRTEVKNKTYPKMMKILNTHIKDKIRC